MLPTKINAARIDAPVENVQPGSWWRLVDPEHELNARRWAPSVERPEHGVILLVSEVRVIDGEIHTIILHNHPGWENRGQVALLAEDFLTAFVEAPDGEALRAQELANLMGQITMISQSMADIPEDTKLLQDAKTENNEGDVEPAPAAAFDARVPAALLPGGDLVATQAKLEAEIQIMKLRQNWIEARQQEMKAGWGLVTAYQSERAAATMAAISSRTQEIASALDNVHSMSLWLGEGVELTELVSGKSAPEEEPLHLMQRLLFLDEEIYTHSMLEDGFCADDMHELGALLSQNPELVTRMLPHPRCVAITRVRRRSRNLPFPRDWAEVFNQMAVQAADQRIQILVRDGQRVTMITADNETSRAERLFPSRAEIDAIFKSRPSYNRTSGKHEVRAITPHDIEYSDKRSEHDKRALFYRRFLLILWGAHEREGVFGPFIPAGSNWLEETVHSERFRFVHDEEEVLSDGRCDVATWMNDVNAALAPGSEVLVQTQKAINPDSCPTAYRYDDQASDSFATHRPENAFELVTVARNGAQLIGKIPCGQISFNATKVVKKPLILRCDKGGVLSEGILCLDNLTSDDLRYYIGSRINRQSYLEWLGLFQRALPLVEARETQERSLVEAILNEGLVAPEHREALERACRAVLQERRNRQGGEAVKRKVVKMVKRLRAGPPPQLPKGALVSLDQRGNFQVLAEDPDIAQTGLPIPLLRKWVCGGSAGRPRRMPGWRNTA